MCDFFPIAHSPFTNPCVSISPMYDKKYGYIAYFTGSTIELFNIENYKQKTIFLDDFEAVVTNILISKKKCIYYTTDKGFIYKYNFGKMELSSKTNLFFSPLSISQSNNKIFMVSEEKLYSFDANTKEKPEILMETVPFTKVYCSPCGRGLILYDIGKNVVFVSILPFEEKKIIRIQLSSSVVSISWGYSNYLSFIIATEDGNIQIWRESQIMNDFNCISSYFTDKRITGFNIAIPKDTYLKDPLFDEIKSKNGNIFPEITEKTMILIVNVESKEKENTLILQYDNDPVLTFIGKISVPSEYTNNVIADMFNMYHMNQFSQKILLCSLNKNGLFTSTIILSKKIQFIKKYNIEFIKHGVKRLLFDKRIIAEDNEGNLTDWTNYKNIENVPYKLEQNKFVYNNLTYEAPYEIKGYQIMNYEDQKMFVLFGERKSSVLFYSNKFKCFDIEETDEKIKSLSIHSTDMFCISTNKSISVYFFKVNKYERIFTKKGENQNAVFMKNTDFPTLFVAVDFHLNLYFITGKDIIEKENVASIPKLDSIIAVNDGIFGCNNNLIVKINVDEKLILKHTEFDSLYYILTKYANAESINFQNDEIIKESDKNVLSKVEKQLPSEINVFDICSKKFLYIYSLSKCYEIPESVMQIASIWALHSPLQQKLFETLNIESLEDLMNSYFFYWAKDRKTLIDMINLFVSTNEPDYDDNNNIDLFVLLSVASGKKIAASKVLNKNGNGKLAVFLTAENNAQKKKKIYKNAYAALSRHRQFLAAMFFILNDNYDDALRVIDNEKNIKYLVARLLDFQIPHVEFFTYWNSKDKNNAYKELFNIDVSKFTLFNAEFIKCEVMLKIEAPCRLYMLKLLDEPLLMKEVMEHSKDAANGTYCNSDVVEDIETEEENIAKNDSEENEEEEKATDYNFDFGGGFGSGAADDIMDDYSYDDYDNYDDEKTEDNNDFNVGYSVKKNIEEIDLEPTCFNTNFLKILMREFSEPCIYEKRIDDDTVSRLLVKLFNYPSEKLSQEILSIASEYKNNISVVLLMCMSYANNYLQMLSCLISNDKNDLKLFTSIVYNDPLIVEHNPIVAFNQIVPSDEYIIRFAFFTHMQQCIKDAIDPTYRKTISVISSYLEYLFHRIETFSFASPKILKRIKLVSEPLAKEFENIYLSRETESYMQLMNDPYKTVFLSGSNEYKKACYVRMDVNFNIKSMCMPFDNSSFVLALHEGVATKISIPMGKQKLKEFNNPLFSYLEIEQFESKFRKKSSIYNVLVEWGSPINDTEVTCVAYHPLGIFALHGSDKGNVHLLRENNHIYSFSECESPVKSIKFNQSGTKIAILHQNGELYLNDFTSSVNLVAKGVGNFVWINNESQFAVIKDDKEKIEIYDWYAGDDPIETFDVVGSPSDTFPFAICNNIIAYGCEKGSIQLFDIKNGELKDNLCIHSAKIVDLASDLSQNMFVSVSEDGGVCLLHGKDTKKISFLSSINEEVNPTCVAISKQIIAVGDECGIRCWIKDTPLEYIFE